MRAAQMVFSTTFAIVRDTVPVVWRVERVVVLGPTGWGGRRFWYTDPIHRTEKREIGAEKKAKSASGTRPSTRSSAATAAGVGRG